MGQRWRMVRAGVLNFWHYDEAQFELASGRLILRGANGSGKSVTMQSFLPLVLDGDKRPHRLDPFGSRDRRMEYYLLVDDDSITDRTGYLWLEFHHGGQDRYLTIGIGLRARRNHPSMGFWGFALTDGRRIGHDFFLYDLNYSQSPDRPSKQPLSRQELEERIGDGGEVVTEQGKYKQLVNRLLFGFADLDAYGELLDLLIQLRSPKLSKDFRPTTIYGILQDALPPLHDDELRPLAEVMDDMDQINDRLNELLVHRAEVEKLDKAYNRYNEHLLFSLSQDLLEAKGREEAIRKELKDQEKALADLEGRLAGEKARQERYRQDLEEIRSEHMALVESEAFEKQAELDRLKREREQLQRDLAAAEGRVDDLSRAIFRARERQEREEARMEEAGEAQARALERMGEAAKASDFALHGLYAPLWEKAIPEDDGFWAPWREDVESHRKKLDEAASLARLAARAQERKQEAEKALGEARAKRDEAEDRRRRAEKGLEEALAEQEKACHLWRQALRWLALPDGAWQGAMHHLSRYPEQGYHRVQEPIQAAFRKARQEVLAAKAEWRQKQKIHEEAYQEWRRQLEEWKTFREPEPPRTEARERFRSQGKGRGAAGAPLYACCEFRPEAPEKVRGAVEGALQQAGLLDAWLSPEGLVLPGGEGVPPEESWLLPEEEFFGNTLADCLTPTPPEGSGLTGQQIDAVLRTIRLADTETVLDGGKGTAAFPGVWISAAGAYRLGSLAGVAAPKDRAEYIGKESRRQTRLAEMARLEGLMAEEEAQIDHCREQAAELDRRLAGLDEEEGAFPPEGLLAEAKEELEKARWHFDAANEECDRRNEGFRQASAQHQEAVARLHEFMRDWTLPRKEEAVEEARRRFRAYEEDFRSLGESWRHYQLARQARQEALEDEARANAQADREEGELENLQARLRDNGTRMETYEKLLKELGIEDIARRLEELRQSAEGLERELKKLQDKTIPELEREWGVAHNQRTVLQQRQAEAAGILGARLGAWLREWKRGLVTDWPGALALSLEGAEDAAREKQALEAAQALVRSSWQQQYGGRGAENIQNHLFEVFHGTRQVLLEYVPETTFDSREGEEGNGRILIHFMRDRHNPITPRQLLQELAAAEEEQRHLLSQKDRELYEEIIIRSVGRTIRDKIHRAEEWVARVNALMQQRNTSSGLRLQLRWLPREAASERELDTVQLVKLLKTNPEQLRDEQIEQMVQHFRTRIAWAKEESDQKDSLRHWVGQLLDYRQWFSFVLFYEKGGQPLRELTDSRFNVLSGGEKAMSMYIPLFAATYSRYNDSRPDSPRIISLDEAFAGVDDENMRDMFDLLTQMDFDYMMTSQVLWGCYDTVPDLSIYEIFRPKDANFVTLFHYHWNGVRRTLVDEGR